ncbi:MAG TPA: CHASE domain-containing protein, partial [Haliangium sp.]|nr:CHASE domain-containing protein [Haliangium sp.]
MPTTLRTSRGTLSAGTATAAGYILLGWIATLLSASPEYALPVWPAAGLACWAVQIFGARIWWGVFLGSTSINTIIGYQSSGSLGLVPLVLAVAIGAGAVVQALVGRRLLAPLVREPDRLAQIIPLLKFLALAGPIACLVNTTWSHLWMLGSGVLPVAELGRSWLLWWIGDSLGALAIVPIGTLYTTTPRRMTAASAVLWGLPAGLALTVTIALFLSTRASETRRIEAVFDNDAEALKIALAATNDKVVSLLAALQGFHDTNLADRGSAADQVVFRHGFHAFARHILHTNPGLQAVGWIPIVHAGERASYEERVRIAGLPRFQITERSETGALRRADERAVYYPVYFVEPMDGNEAALGFDLGSQRDRLAALRAAESTGKPAATEPIRLVQEQASQAAVTVYLATQRQPRAASAHTGRPIAGYVAVALRIDD